MSLLKRQLSLVSPAALQTAAVRTGRHKPAAAHSLFHIQQRVSARRCTNRLENKSSDVYRKIEMLCWRCKLTDSPFPRLSDLLAAWWASSLCSRTIALCLCMNVHVMFAELALNVGSTDVLEVWIKKHDVMVSVSSSGRVCEVSTWRYSSDSLNQKITLLCKRGQGSEGNLFQEKAFY